MSELTEEETKFQVLNYLKQGDLSAREIASELSVPYPKVLRWKKEFNDAEVKGEVNTAIEADKVLLARVAEETAQELADLADTPEDKEAIVEVIEGAVLKLEGLQLLEDKFQKAAINLAEKITLLTAGPLEVKEILALAEALSKLQMSFFAKGTNVNILNQNGVSDTGVNKFGGLKRP